MKKMKFLVATLLLTGATFSGYRAYESYVTSQDELLMLNLAALANNEGGNNNGETNNGNSESGNSNSESSTPSNENGGNRFYYPTRGSKPVECYIYVTDATNGAIRKILGVEEVCVNIGYGCTIDKCTEI